MARHVGRTKACKTCRARKIKCDEKYPTCTQCAKSHRRCPGAVQGNVFLQLGSANDQGYVRQDNGIAVVGKQKDDSVPNVSEACRFVIYTPDTTIFIQNQLIGPLLLFWSDGGAAFKWQSHLTGMIDAPAWRCSVLGASLLFHRQLVGEERSRIEYRKYYTKALRYQKYRIQNICDRAAPATFDDMVHTMTLAYIESMWATSTHGTHYHVSAAVDLLDRLGPHYVQTGQHWNLFRDVRVLSAFISITEWKPSVFASPRWMTVPFEDKTQTSYDLICDFLLLLPVIFHSRNEDHLLLRKAQDSVVEKLLGIWSKIAQENPFCLTIKTPLSSIESVRNTGWQHFVPPMMSDPHKSDLISLTLYSMAWIVFLTRTSVISSSGSFDELLIAHSKTMLYNAQHQKLHRASDYVFTLAALKVVSCASPDTSQRKSATRIIQKGAEKTGLAGMLDCDILRLESYR